MSLLLRSLLLLAVLAGASCRSASTGTPNSSGTEAPLAGKVTVFAAASLTDAFKEIGSAFSAKNAVSVEFNFAGSPTLRTQLEQGARADVYASAYQAQMDLAVRS